LNGELLQFTRPSPFSLPPEPRPAAGEAAAPKIRILVAEDDAVTRELICTRLENWGYEAVPTQNGTDAIMALRRKNAPVLAVIDWMMPGMDGLEICRRVREVNRVLYVILLTSRSAKENVIEGLGAGADDYLIKPFDKEELQARILVGLRVMALQTALAVRVNKLEAESIASNGWR
jgi:DNA-binding response OmpR family regulator